jgi:hypothetical protein
MPFLPVSRLGILLYFRSLICLVVSVHTLHEDMQVRTAVVSNADSRIRMSHEKPSDLVPMIFF